MMAFNFLCILQLILPLIHKVHSDVQCTNCTSAQGYIENVVEVKVNQSLEQTTVDLRNVMVASSEIINLILVPQMKEKMLEIETQVRNEVKMDFNREKKEMAADMEAKFAEEKQIFVTNLQNEYRLKEQALVANLEEKLRMCMKTEIT